MQGFIEELCWGFTVAEEAAWCCGFWGGHQDLGEVEAQRAFFNRRGSQAPPLHPGKTPPPYHTCQAFWGCWGVVELLERQMLLCYLGLCAAKILLA